MSNEKEITDELEESFNYMGLELVKVENIPRQMPSLLEDQLQPLPNSKAEEVVLYELLPLEEAE